MGPAEDSLQKKPMRQVGHQEREQKVKFRSTQVLNGDERDTATAPKC